VSEAELDSSLSELVEAARQGAAQAYAPYSRYRVGAAVRGASGRVYAGCNVENASYGAAICAERVAVAKLVSAGETELTELAVWTAGPDLAMPCGICRQVAAEFGRNAVVVVAVPGFVRQTRLSDLFPEPFVFKP
jgi:cytidine deaminase